MFRSSWMMVALQLVIAAESCSLKDCGKDLEDSQGLVASLAPGAEFLYEANNCSTSAHASSTVTWSVTAGAPANEQVRLDAQSSCPANALCCQAEAPRTATVATGKIEAALTNAKNLCGDDAEIHWRLKVTNSTSMPIQNVVVKVSCPRVGGSNVNVAPSAVSAR